MSLTAGWWEVIRTTPHTYERTKYNKHGTPIGTETVTEPAGWVVGEHRVRETAQRHADKNNRQFKAKGRRYEIRRKA